MKNIKKIALLFLALSAGCFVACNDDDNLDLPSQTKEEGGGTVSSQHPDAANLVNTLAGSDLGWRLDYTAGGQTYVFLLQFDRQDMVESDSPNFPVEPYASLYETANDNGTLVLKFQTKTQLNLLPSEYIETAINISAFTSELISGTGATHGITMNLKRATQADRDLLNGKELWKKIAAQNLMSGIMVANGKFTLTYSFNMEASTATLIYVGADNKTVTTTVPVTMNEGFTRVMWDAVNVDGGTLTGLEYTENTNVFSIAGTAASANTLSVGGLMTDLDTEFIADYQYEINSSAGAWAPYFNAEFGGTPIRSIEFNFQGSWNDLVFIGVPERGYLFGTFASPVKMSDDNAAIFQFAGWNSNYNNPDDIVVAQGQFPLFWKFIFENEGGVYLIFERTAAGTKPYVHIYDSTDGNQWVKIQRKTAD